MDGIDKVTVEAKIGEKIGEIAVASKALHKEYEARRSVLDYVHARLTKDTLAASVLTGAVFARPVNGVMYGWASDGFLERSVDVSKSSGGTALPLQSQNYAAAIERLPEILDAVAVAIASRRARC